MSSPSAVDRRPASRAVPSSEWTQHEPGQPPVRPPGGAAQLLGASVGPGVCLTSTQTALELPSEARCHGVPRLLSQRSPELPIPWGCAGLTPTLPGRAGPHSCCARDPSAEVRSGEMGADFPEPSFRVDVNCPSCSTAESRLRWGASLRRQCQDGQHPRGIAK